MLELINWNASGVRRRSAGATNDATLNTVGFLLFVPAA